MVLWSKNDHLENKIIKEDELNEQIWKVQTYNKENLLKLSVCWMPHDSVFWSIRWKKYKKDSGKYSAFLKMDSVLVNKMKAEVS